MSDGVRARAAWCILRVIRYVLVCPDVLLSPCTAVVDNMCRCRPGAAQRIESEDVVVEHRNRNRVFDGGHACKEVGNAIGVESLDVAYHRQCT